MMTSTQLRRPGGSQLRRDSPRANPCAAATLALLACSSANAGERLPTLPRVSLAVGAWHIDADARIGGTGFDRSFDTRRFTVSDKARTVPRARLDLTLGARHGFTFEYYELSTGRSIERSQSFTYQGTEYTASARVSADLEIDVGTADYRLWLGGGDTTVGLGVGAAAYRVEADVTGRATLNGNAVQARADYSTSTVAPMASIGLRHRVREDLHLYADASGIRRSGGRLRGHIYSAAAGTEWYPWQHFGFGVEWAVKRVRLMREFSQAEGRLDLRFHGPFVYLKSRF